MAETEESKRKSKLNMDEIYQIMYKLGNLKLPRNFGKNKIVPRERKPARYLTTGLSPGCMGKSEATAIIRETTPVTDGRSKLGSYRDLNIYTTRLEANKLDRLFVPSDTLLPGKSIIADIDPEYFTIVSGRPIKERGTLREYTWAVRNTFLTRLETVRLEAEIAKLEKTRKDGEEAFIRAKVTLANQKKSFEKFLHEDHAKSVECLADAEAAAAESQEKEEKLIVLRKESDKTKTRVLLLEEQWRHCKMLQNFLYSVSPLSWRRIYDYLHQKDGNIDPVEPSLFQRLRGASLTVRDEINSKIERFMFETRSCEAPGLYFEDPDQLFTVFRDLEERNLSSLLQCELVMPSVETMNAALDEAEKDFEEERLTFTQDVADMTQLLEKEEAEAKRLEDEVQKLSRGHLHDLLTDRRAIIITAYVEDAFERVVGPNDIGLGALDMMKAIQRKHEELMLLLDVLPEDVVGKCKTSWEREDKRIKKEAKDASKKVHQMNMLTKKLSGALKPWSARPRRRLVQRSAPPQEKAVKPPPLAPLTTDQIEQRHFYQDVEGADRYRPLC